MFPPYLALITLIISHFEHGFLILPMLKPSVISFCASAIKAHLKNVPHGLSIGYEI